MDKTSAASSVPSPNRIARARSDKRHSMTERKAYKRALSEEEFGRLFAECRTPFVRIANSYVHDRAVAEDLVNDSFVRLWEKRSEILTDSFESYVFHTVVRKCLDHLKSEKTQSQIRQHIGQSRYRMLAYEINSLESSDPGRLYESEVERLIQEAVDRMPARTREIFLAHRMENKTYQEIAETYGIPVRRVSAEIQSALRFLRHALKDYLPAVLLAALFLR